MKKLAKNTSFLVIALILVSLFGASAYADNGDYAIDSAEYTYDGSHFVSGQTVNESESVKGVLAAAGYDVNLTGVSQYTAGAGYNVRSAGETLNDAFLAGYNVSIDGVTARDLYAAGNTVTVSGVVSRSAYLAGNTVSVSGKIGGDLYIDAQNVSIADTAEINGTIRISDSANVTASESTEKSIEWYKSEASARSESISEAVQTVSAASRVGSWVFSLVGLIIVALVLLWLTPLWETVDKRYFGAPFVAYARAFGIGFAVLAGVPVAAILLMFTRIGLRLAFVLLFTYVAAIIAAKAFISFVLGALIWRNLLKKAPKYLAELPIGVLAVCLAEIIPGLGFAVGFAAVPLGLGMITLLLGKKNTPADDPAALPASVAE